MAAWNIFQPACQSTLGDIVMDRAGLIIVIPRRIIFPCFEMENACTLELIIMFYGHELLSSNYCINHFHHAQHGFHIMHPDDIRPPGYANGDGGSRSFQTLIRREIEEITNKGFPRGPKQNRETERPDLIKTVDEFEVLRDRLAETNPGV